MRSILLAGSPTRLIKLSVYRSANVTHHSRNDEPLVIIASYPTSFEASLARGAPEAAGIAAFVPSETLGTFARNRGGPPHGVLQVFESDRDRAVAELRRMELRVVKPTDEE